MKNFDWQDTFLSLFDRCLARYRAGDADWTRYYSADDSAFLQRIGCQPREFFDFVEDHGDGEPVSPATALLVAAVRRDYFMVVQHGRGALAFTAADRLPAKDDDSLGGTAYWARMVMKARLKLRGELDPEIMFGCGGDREVLMACDVHPADFLRHVWASGEDDSKILALLQSAHPTAS